MTNSSKRKGDSAELEVQAIFREQVGVGRRALGAGRKDDMGDMTNIPELTVQVVNYRDVAKAVRHKPVECEEQRVRAGTAFAATFVRLRGTSVMPADYRVVLTVEQFFCLYREAIRVILGRGPQDTLFNVQETQRCSCGATKKILCVWVVNRDLHGLDEKQPRSCLLRHDPATAPLPEGF